MKVQVKPPRAILKAAQKEKVDVGRMIEWLLRSMDPDLVKETARNFKKFG